MPPPHRLGLLSLNDTSWTCILKTAPRIFPASNKLLAVVQPSLHHLTPSISHHKIKMAAPSSTILWSCHASLPAVWDINTSGHSRALDQEGHACSIVLDVSLSHPISTLKPRQCSFVLPAVLSNMFPHLFQLVSLSPLHPNLLLHLLIVFFCPAEFSQM